MGVWDKKQRLLTGITDLLTSLRVKSMNNHVE
jgi:hypothetical protein